MIRPTVATVDLDALAANCRAVIDLLAREGAAAGRTTPPGVMAVVKANAYGHGAAPVAAVFEAAGAGMLACADIEEGVLLRQAGIRVPILVFGALSVSDLDGIVDYDLTPTVSTPAAARALEALADRRQMTLSCHLKIDTGMNRLGFRHDNLRTTMPAVIGCPHLKVEALYTHFASADVPESPLLDEQRRRFERTTAALGAMGVRGVPRHAANSAALLRDTRTWFDLVRPGLLLYGIVPPPLAASLPLRPGLSLTSRIVAVKGIRPGEGAGYGPNFAADSPRTIAVVPAGYADGLDTRLSGRGSALVGGRRVAIVGAVSMDMLTIDVTGLDVNPGAEVVLIGRQQGEEITAREVAAAIGAIPWEVVCRLGSRIERQHVGRLDEVRGTQ